MPCKLAVRHSHSLSDPVLCLVTQANNLTAFLNIYWASFKAMKSKALNAMPALSKFLILLAMFLLASYAHAFTSLSPFAGNQARVNHLIRFEKSMSDPTNEPSCEPIREPTNNRKKSEPIVSYSHIIRDQSTPTFQLVVASVSNNNALSFNDNSSSKYQLVVASVENECSKGPSMKTAQRAIGSKCKSFQDNVNQIERNESSATFKLVVASVLKKYALSFVDKSSATLKLVVASVTNEDLKGSTNGSIARFEHLPVGATVAPTFFNGKITSIFQLVVAFVANKYKHDCINRHPSKENGLRLFDKKHIKLIVDSEGAQYAPATLQVQACNHQTDFQ
jgi:hypothetical protein